MDEKQRELEQDEPPETAGEGNDEDELVSTDQHSDAPGETGTGSREGDPEHGKPYRQ